MTAAVAVYGFGGCLKGGNGFRQLAEAVMKLAVAVAKWVMEALTSVQGSIYWKIRPPRGGGGINMA